MRKRWLLVLTVCLPVLGLAACGFHLRRGAQLPSSMLRIHLVVSGGGNLQRELARQLEISGATLVDAPGPGVAEMSVPQAQFQTAALTYTGQARVGEYAVRYNVQFQVLDATGKVIMPLQSVHISREFTYDAQDPVGTATQTEQLQASMLTDAVQAIMFRVSATARHATSTSKPAPAAGATGH